MNHSLTLYASVLCLPTFLVPLVPAQAVAAGTSVELPLNMNFSADAYEELPISTETVYSTTGRGKRKVTTATNRSAAEDNGFLTTLDIPVQRHITLSGFYNRSLRDHIDTAGFSLTFFLRAPPRPKEY